MKYKNNTLGLHHEMIFIPKKSHNVYYKRILHATIRGIQYSNKA